MRRIGFYICLAVLLFSFGMTARYISDSIRADAVTKEAQSIYHITAEGTVPTVSAELPESTPIPAISAATSGSAVPASSPAPSAVPESSAVPAGTPLPANILVSASIPVGTITKVDMTTSSAIFDTKVQEKFLELLKVNKDVVGWIKVPDTVIDYPVMQSTDNKYYLEHDINGKKLKSGSIFMDYRNTPAGENWNTILYGHHMKNGTMFKDLMKYKKKDFFKKNRVISFDTLYGNSRWEIFSVYITDIYFDYIQTRFETTEEYLGFLNRITNKSLYKSDVKLGENDKILTLSTCTYEFDNARLAIHARLLN